MSEQDKAVKFIAKEFDTDEGTALVALTHGHWNISVTKGLMANSTFMYMCMREAIQASL